MCLAVEIVENKYPDNFRIREDEEFYEMWVSIYLFINY